MSRATFLILMIISFGIVHIIGVISNIDDKYFWVISAGSAWVLLLLIAIHYLCILTGVAVDTRTYNPAAVEKIRPIIHDLTNTSLSQGGTAEEVLIFYEEMLARTLQFTPTTEKTRFVQCSIDFLKIIKKKIDTEQ